MKQKLETPHASKTYALMTSQKRIIRFDDYIQQQLDANEESRYNFEFCFISTVRMIIDLSR